MIKKLLYALIVLVIAVAIGGLILWNLPAENVAKKDADFNLTATELFEEYSANEKASNTKYIDKIVKVNGTIDAIETDEQGAKVILIAGSDMGNGVLCTLQHDDPKASTLKTGQTVTIKGRCTGMLMDVVLNKCSVQ